MEMVEKSGSGSRGIESTEVMGSEDFRFAAGRNRLRHAGFQKAGQDRVHPDALVAMTAGERTGQTEQSGLGGGIGRLALRGMDRRVTGNEDDVTGSLFDHSGQGSFGAIGSSLIIHRKHLVPRAFGGTQQEAVPGDSRGADEKVHGSEFEIPPDRFWIRDIQLSVTGCGDVPVRRCECLDDRLAQELRKRLGITSE